MANLQIIKQPPMESPPCLALPLALTDIAHQSPASAPSRPATYPKSSEISWRLEFFVISYVFMVVYLDLMGLSRDFMGLRWDFQEFHGIWFFHRFSQIKNGTIVYRCLLGSFGDIVFVFASSTTTYCTDSPRGWKTVPEPAVFTGNQRSVFFGGFHQPYGGFHKWSTPNGWFIVDNPIKMNDLGVALFLETNHMGELKDTADYCGRNPVPVGIGNHETL